MNLIAEQLLDGVNMLEEILGATMTWAGQSFPCVGGAELGSKRLEAGGYRAEADVQIVVRTAVFPAGRPQEKQVLTYVSAAGAPGRRLRIEGVTTIYETLLVLDCNEAP